MPGLSEATKFWIIVQTLAIVGVRMQIKNGQERQLFMKNFW